MGLNFTDMITAQFSIGKGRGSYLVYNKTFNDKRHLDNYINLLYRKGTKLIGYVILETK
jgi:hypothetical protein